MKNAIQQRITGIIPARYGSARFPGKPLAMLGGKRMIERVYTQAAKALNEVWVATDDERIRAEVESFGGRVVMTSSSHRSGTDRCAEALEKIFGSNEGYDNVIINIQGDEPFIRPEQIKRLAECFNDYDVRIATLVRKCDTCDELANPNQPKVVLSKSMDAMYFSRSVIPFYRDLSPDRWSSEHVYYKHIGLYGYRAETLRTLTALPQSSLELAESLEQLRWLENGFSIRCAVTQWESIGIDTPEDLVKAEEYLASSGS